MTSDGKTIVCFHPSADAPYELTQVDVTSNSLYESTQILQQHLENMLVCLMCFSADSPTSRPQ